MQLAATYSTAAVAAAASKPLTDANPRLDPIVEQQARFRIDGAGPLSTRAIVPVTSMARLLVETVGQRPVTDAVRGVVRLVEHAAGGPGGSSSAQLNGVAFSADASGHAANGYRAHLDDDEVLHGSLAAATSPAQRARMLEEWATGALPGLGESKASVAAGWINLGPAASSALLIHNGITAPGSALMTNEATLAETVRVLRHEAQHAADASRPKLEQAGSYSLREAIAESNSTTLPQLRTARAILGLDGAVGDVALENAARQVRPYPGSEHVLREALQAVGITPGSAAAAQLLARPAAEVGEELVARIARAEGTSNEQARADLGREFGAVLGYEL